MLYVVIQLDLYFVLKLSGLGEEVFLVHVFSKSCVVLCDKLHFADAGPGVEAIAHGVLRPDSDVLASL